jgi:NAD(P)-dependent dehydrogenase (short-subunit alcohol dehydrogenase family)
MKQLRFDGRVAIVTGAGRGIGREEALLLARRGARVVVNDWGRATDGSPLREDPARAVVEEIAAAGGEAVADGSDVGTLEGCAAVVDRGLERWGRLDIVVNNAGAFGRADSPGALSEELIDMTLRTHLVSTMRVCRQVWPIFVAQRYGRIVNTSSAEVLGVPNSWDYPAAKGGVLAYTRSLAVTGTADGIRANAIMPMAFTRALHDYPDKAVRAWMEANFTPRQVAPATAFLAHEGVPCNGECFAVGAGRMARIAIVGSPGYQRPDGELTAEDVAEHWTEITDLSDWRLLATSRDESALYRNPLDAP